MENFFQNFKRRLRNSISMGRGVTEVERNPNCPPIVPDVICGEAREVIWSQYRPGINIFARVLVRNHNKKENANLKFVKVVNAKSLACPGLVYAITLKAKDGDKLNVYETKISLENWRDWKEMINLGEVHLSHNQWQD